MTWHQTTHLHGHPNIHGKEGLLSEEEVAPEQQTIFFFLQSLFQLIYLQVFYVYEICNPYFAVYLKSSERMAYTSRRRQVSANSPALILPALDGQRPVKGSDPS